VTAKIMKDDYLSPRRIKPGHPRRLQCIIRKCLRKKPGRRFGSMLEVEKKAGEAARGKNDKGRLAPPDRRISRVPEAVRCGPGTGDHHHHGQAQDVGAVPECHYRQLDASPAGAVAGAYYYSPDDVGAKRSTAASRAAGRPTPSVNAPQDDHRPDSDRDGFACFARHAGCHGPHRSAPRRLRCGRPKLRRRRRWDRNKPRQHRGGKNPLRPKKEEKDPSRQTDGSRSPPPSEHSDCPYYHAQRTRLPSARCRRLCVRAPRASHEGKRPARSVSRERASGHGRGGFVYVKVVSGVMRRVRVGAAAKTLRVNGLPNTLFLPVLPVHFLEDGAGDLSNGVVEELEGGPPAHDAEELGVRGVMEGAAIMELLDLGRS